MPIVSIVEEQGYIAGSHGILGPNPYREDFDQHLLWEEGWKNGIEVYNNKNDSELKEQDRFWCKGYNAGIRGDGETLPLWFFNATSTCWLGRRQ